MSAQISLTNKQQNVLLQIITSRTRQQDHIERAKIILLAFEGKANKKIQSELNVTQPTVTKWLSRWLKNKDRLLLIDENEIGVNYVRKILEILVERLKLNNG